MVELVGRNGRYSDAPTAGVIESENVREEDQPDHSDGIWRNMHDDAPIVLHLEELKVKTRVGP